jgi:hypothetical protein
MSIKKLFIKGSKLIGAKEDKEGKLQGGVELDGFITEKHNIGANITENPIEDGVIVSDHIQLKPVNIIIETIVTNSLTDNIIQSAKDMFSGAFDFKNFKDRPAVKYKELLDIFQKRDIFDIQTELKLYKNLALKNISVDQDVNTANCLIAKLEFQEIIIVESEVKENDVSSMDSDEINTKQDSQNLGTKQPKAPSNKSVLLGGLQKGGVLL